MSSIRAMTRLRLVLYVMGSLAFGSDVHRLMQPTLDRNFCPGWTNLGPLAGVVELETGLRNGAGAFRVLEA